MYHYVQFLYFVEKPMPTSCNLKTQPCASTIKPKTKNFFNSCCLPIRLFFCNSSNKTQPQVIEHPARTTIINSSYLFTTLPSIDETTQINIPIHQQQKPENHTAPTPDALKEILMKALKETEDELKNDEADNGTEPCGEFECIFQSKFATIKDKFETQTLKMALYLILYDEPSIKNSEICTPLSTHMIQEVADSLLRLCKEKNEDNGFRVMAYLHNYFLLDDNHINPSTTASSEEKFEQRPIPNFPSTILTLSSLEENYDDPTEHLKAALALDLSRITNKKLRQLFELIAENRNGYKAYYTNRIVKKEAPLDTRACQEKIRQLRHNENINIETSNSAHESTNDNAMLISYYSSLPGFIHNPIINTPSPTRSSTRNAR